MMADSEADAVTLAVATDDAYFLAHIGENPGVDPTKWRKASKAVLSVLLTGATMVDDAAGVAETDRDAIDAAITAAGVGGTVVFRPGQTYVTSGGHVPLTGQTWVMYGATIQRMDEVTGTSSTAITVGPTSHVIDLGTDAAAQGWFVGMFAGFSDGTNTNSTVYDPFRHTVTAVSGNTITVSIAFTVPSATLGTPYTVASVGHTINIQPTPAVNDAIFLGGTLDGNRANNATLTKWELQKEFLNIGTENLRIYAMNVINAPAEAIVFGGNGTIIDGVKTKNTGGAAFHSSGVGEGGALVTNAVIIDSRQTVDVTGHGSGAISYSLATGKVIYNNFQLDGSLYGGISGISDITNSETQFVNGYVSNTSGADIFEANSGDSVANVLVRGVRFIGAHGVNDRIKIGNSDTLGPVKFRMYDCTTSGITCQIRGADDVVLRGNSWSWTSGASAVVGINVEDSTNVTIDDTIDGGNYGVLIKDTSSNITVMGNIKNFRIAGVRDQSSGAGNIIKPTTLRDGAYTLSSGARNGIQITNTNPVTIRDIDIRLTVIPADQPAILSEGSDGGQITGCTIRHAKGSTNDAIGVTGDNNAIVNNYIESGLTINDTGTGNVITPNYTVTA